MIELPCILKLEYIVNSVLPCFYVMNYTNYTEIFFLSVSSMDNPDNEIVLYLMLRAVDRFHKQHGRYPGKNSNQIIKYNKIFFFGRTAWLVGS